MLVALQDNALSDLILLQPERPGSVRVVGPAATAGLHVGAVYDERRRVRQLGEEVGLRLVDGYAQRRVVHNPNARDLGRVTP